MRPVYKYPKNSIRPTSIIFSAPILARFAWNIFALFIWCHCGTEYFVAKFFSVKIHDVDIGLV